jgi:hypothetical protein
VFLLPWIVEEAVGKERLADDTGKCVVGGKVAVLCLWCRYVSPKGLAARGIRRFLSAEFNVSFSSLAVDRSIALPARRADGASLFPIALSPIANPCTVT